MNGRDGFSRRRFLHLSGLAAGGVAGIALAGCGRTTAQETQPAGGGGGATAAATPGATSAAAVPQGKVTLRWWDHFQPLVPLHKQVFAKYSAAHPNVVVEQNVYNPNEMGQALQLAYKSGQMADVHTLVGLGVPVPRLVADGWFQPLGDGGEIRKRLPAGSLLEGVTLFGGKVYSFPLFSFRQYTSLNWFNKDLLAGAGGDPATGPKTWDEFRQLANAITKKGGGQAFGWIQGVQFTERLAIHVEDLAQAAGAPGVTDPKTGQYTYATEPFARAIEFLLALQKDGALFPASASLDARTARARWATGVAGFFLDGPWNVGVIQGQFKDFLDKVGLAPMPVADGTKPAYLYNGPPTSNFFVSSQSKNPAVASQVLLELTTPEYYVGLAERMDQPPLDLTAVDRANVHPTYKQAMKLFQETVRLVPSPVVRNAAAADVLGEMKTIRPNLGEITQGTLSGDVKDHRAALKEYADKITAERERAIKVVRDKGGQVSADDWVFANWEPGKDYTAESYKK